jgi:hypothetical protein
MGTLHQDQYISSIVSLYFRLRMRNVSDEICRDDQNLRFILNNLLSKIVPFVG